MSRHWSGSRTGFNQRGGTDREHLRLQTESRKAECEKAMAKVLEAIGPDAYNAWVDQLPDVATWSQYKALAEAKLVEAAQRSCLENSMVPSF